MNESNAGRRPGRPRNGQTEAKILQAARELIMENGMQSFSMDSLALRSGVSKPTIYRRWPTKEELLTDCFGFASDPREAPDTGDALKDLALLLGGMLASLGERIGASPGSVHRMVAAMVDSPQTLSQYKKNFIEPRRKLYGQIIRRGKQRGQIREDAEEEALIDLVGGAYLYGLLFAPEKLATGAWLEQVMEQLGRGLRKPE